MRSSGDFSSTEILLWEHFCSLVKFKKDRQVQIFRAQLAAMIHRSEPTITRHVRGLVKKGFLVRSANYRSNCKGDLKKFRTANSYQVCLPEQVYNKIMERDQEQRQKIEEHQHKVAKEPGKSVNNAEGKAVERKPAELSNALELTNRTAQNSNCLPIKNTQNINIKKTNINTKNNNQAALDTTVDGLKPSYALINPVVVFEKIETKLKANRVEIELLEHKKSIANAKLAASNESILRHQALEEYTTLDSAQIRLATENQGLEHQLKQLKTQQQNQTDSSWIASIDGARPINERLRCYLNRKLHELGYDPATAAGCAKFNEIVWSSRFGDMARNNITQKENSLLRAFNCCLKLVRENTWETPTGFWGFVANRTNLRNSSACYAR